MEVWAHCRPATTICRQRPDRDEAPHHVRRHLGKQTNKKSCSFCCLALLGTTEDKHSKKPSNQTINLSFSIHWTESPISCLLLKDRLCYAGTVDLNSEKCCLWCRQADVLPAPKRIGCCGRL